MFRKLLMATFLTLLIFTEGFLTCDLSQAAPVTLMLEDFEDNTVHFSSSSALFHDGSNDYFTITPLNGVSDPIDAYSGFGGNNYFAAEDIDDGATRPSTATLSFNINISNFESLTFDGLFAVGGNGAAIPTYDDEESVLVRATIDAGPTQNLLAFEAVEPGGDVTNNIVRQDTDFDGIGDGFMPTSTFTAFNDLVIVGDGANLLLEVVVTSTDGGSEFAFDNLAVRGISSVPEPSSLACLLVTGFVWTSRRRKQAKS
ncbi:hypothetical protein CA13_33560 [Planctomycetes bacterium CA13]|uniref:PEP-CTERM protein-sorting domain-containing protein n=1 Tax=Novipirellula herctigrandis TaxID=2527986 RepID=A0A5C5Z509_9BACT|nr:hypothetical protein CA13_33560 [Planctomycetes bacterium CA13]